MRDLSVGPLALPATTMVADQHKRRATLLDVSTLGGQPCRQIGKIGPKRGRIFHEGRLASNGAQVRTLANSPIAPRSARLDNRHDAQPRRYPYTCCVISRHERNPPARELYRVT